MLYSDFTSKLLGLEEICPENIEQKENKIEITFSMTRKKQLCPCCKCESTTVHDYRKQAVRDIPMQGKNVVLMLRKRRYRCLQCSKRFYEETPFLPRYQRMTNRLAAFVIHQLAGVRSFADVASEIGVSTATVIRIFDIVSYPKPALPRVLAIDEFKGNTAGEKYQCILTDAENRIVLDILPKRYSSDLTHYFVKSNREKVDYFVSDMWKPYADLASKLLPKATQLVDKFHYIRQAIWAFEAVRKEEQKKFSDTHRRYFKRSKKLLTCRFSKLKPEEKQQVNVMLYASATLSSAYVLKEKFFEVIDEQDKAVAKKLFSEWVFIAHNSDIPQFVKCADTYIHWSKSILNTFDVTFTNGFTEGCNNKIKILKRNAYGYRDFRRFRNRILHMFSYQRISKNEKATA